MLLCSVTSFVDFVTLKRICLKRYLLPLSYYYFDYNSIKVDRLTFKLVPKYLKLQPIASSGVQWAICLSRVLRKRNLMQVLKVSQNISLYNKGHYFPPKLDCRLEKLLVNEKFRKIGHMLIWDDILRTLHAHFTHTSRTLHAHFMHSSCTR